MGSQSGPAAASTRACGRLWSSTEPSSLLPPSPVAGAGSSCCYRPQRCALGSLLLEVVRRTGPRAGAAGAGAEGAGAAGGSRAGGPRRQPPGAWGVRLLLALLARLAHAKRYEGQILSYKSWVYVDKFVFDISGRGKPCTLHPTPAPYTLNPKP